MTVQLNISDVILHPELNAAQITITPIFSSGVPDVNKQYVDEGLDLKVDKVDGKGLSTEDYTTAEKSKVANVPLNTNTELAAKVDKVEGKSLVPDTEIDKLAEYPEFEDLEFSHANLTDKNSEAAFQHVDTTTTKETLDEADKVALWDSVTGKVVLSNALNDIETILASI